MISKATEGSEFISASKVLEEDFSKGFVKIKFNTAARSILIRYRLKRVAG